MAQWRVVLAEDEPLIAQLTVAMLADLPLEVSVARDGKEALRQAQTIQPDLILLDAMMPGLDGFEVAEALKADPATQDIPIIFMTARSRDEDKVRGLELGADDYLIKPIKREELLARVRNILRRSESRRPSPAGTSLMRGLLEMISLPNIIQALEMERRTGRLRLASKGHHGEILFVDGRIASATEGARQGEAAVYRLVTWGEGEFTLEPAAGTTPLEALVTKSNQSLLLEGARRLDEITALRQDLAPLEGPIRMFPSFRQGMLHRALPRELHQLVDLCDGTRTVPELVEASSLDEWETLNLLVRFLRLGMLEQAHTPKRVSPRLGIQLPVDFQVLKEFSGGTSFDISSRGMFLQTTQVLPSGQMLLVRFTLPGVDHTFKAVGQVVWSSPTDSRGHPAGMGIQFLDMSEDERSAIEQYIVNAALDGALAAEPEK